MQSFLTGKMHNRFFKNYMYFLSPIVAKSTVPGSILCELSRLVLLEIMHEAAVSQTGWFYATVIYFNLIQRSLSPYERDWLIFVRKTPGVICISIHKRARNYCITP